MIQKIISITILLVIGLLTYNYFFGTAQEREQAQDIFGKGAEVVGASADLLKAEYQKFNDGKYDEALNNINGLLSNCLLYTSDAADERSSVDLGGRRIIKKKQIQDIRRDL